MKFILKILSTLTLFIASAVQAQWDYGFDFSKAGSAGLQYLKIGAGARESGMGEAAICLSRGANSIFWNPSGIAYVNGGEASFSYNRWLLNIDHSAMAVAMNIKNLAVVGVSFLYMGVPEFEETTVQMQDGTGRMVSANDMAIGLGVARRFTNKLAMGVHVQYVREKLDQDSFSNILLDIGASYFTGFRNFVIAVSAQHFGPDIKMLRDRFRMPLIFKVGLADHLIHGEHQRLTVAMDLLHPTDNTERMNFGLEYGLYETLFIRGGYRLNSDLGAWAFGAGLCTSFSGLRGSVDYSYNDFGAIMGSVNRISFQFSF